MIEKNDKSDLLDKSQTVGYRSVHYVVHLNTSRLALPEYSRFRGLVAEIQVRTILQHAWAEIEHDTRYKAVDVAPTAIARRFVALAGLLEIADREFQALQGSYERVSHEARQLVAQGRLNDVEVTPEVLRAYLDNKLGPDRRMAQCWGMSLDRQIAGWHAFGWGTAERRSRRRSSSSLPSAAGR